MRFMPFPKLPTYAANAMPSAAFAFIMTEFTADKAKNKRSGREIGQVASGKSPDL
jgi:hypothetical protein